MVTPDDASVLYIRQIVTVANLASGDHAHVLRSTIDLAVIDQHQGSRQHAVCLNSVNYASFQTSGKPLPRLFTHHDCGDLVPWPQTPLPGFRLPYIVQRT
jgi:hypothetical protein